MIQKAKKPLSNQLFFPFFGCLISLIIFFIYAIKFESAFFIPLSIAQIFIIVSLILLRFYLIRKKSEGDLEKEDIRERINLLRADIAQEEQLIKGLGERITNYIHLKGMTEELCECFTLRDTVLALCWALEKFFPEEAITKIIFLFEVSQEKVEHLSKIKGMRPLSVRSKIEDYLDEWVSRKNQPLLIESAKKDFRFDIEKITQAQKRDINAVISIPLVARDRVIGLIRLDSPQERKFNIEDLRLLTAIGDLWSVTIENVRLYEHLEQLAIKDGLTGLFLRRHLLERGTKEIERHFRQKKPLAFLMIDLDNFKKYNDRYGHTAGDIVLKFLAKLLLESFKEHKALICRYGGEEFGVLLADCSKREAMRLAEDFRKKVAHQDIILRQKKTKITVSIGVATLPEDGNTQEAIIQVADNAMYQAKNRGRNKVCCL